MENEKDNLKTNEALSKNENTEISKFKKFVSKNLSTIAVVISTLSILLSIFTLTTTRNHRGRDGAPRPFNMQANIPYNDFNNDNFNRPNDIHYYGQGPRVNNGKNGGRSNFGRNSKNGTDNNNKNSSKNNRPKYNQNGPSTSDAGPKVAPKISPNNN